MDRDTTLVTTASLLLVAGLVAFQGLHDPSAGRSAGPQPGATPSQSASASPSSSSSPSGTPAPSRDTSPIPGDWTTLDHRPVTAPELTLARNEPVEDPAYPDTSQPEVDALRYDLDLDWDGRTLRGDARITLRVTAQTDTLTLGLADDLEARAVALDGRAMRVEQRDDQLVVGTPALGVDSVHTLVVRYEGVPAPVPAPSTRPDDDGGLGWGYDKEGNVSAYQEPYGAFTWYPVHDHPSDKAFYDARITAPPGQLGVFNGRLTGREDAGGRTTTTWHLDSPTSSYLTTIAIGRYRQHVETLPGGIPASVWTLPQDESRAPRLQRELRTSMDWLTSRVGRYPFSSVGMVVTEGQSAMETQTLLTMGRGPVVLQPAEVTVHELAHQWYGDLVTTRDWRTTWLNEGWAMYWELVYRAEHGSAIAADAVRQGCASSVEKDGQAGNPKPDHFAANNIYLCPALMLQELRTQVGDQTFLRLAREWPAQHRYATATREDFERFAQEVTGVDVRPLTRRWLDDVDPDALTRSR